MKKPFAGLYVHVPFCSAICPYCDFAVLKAPQARIDSFVDLLLQEAESVEDSWEFETLYLGGGTPSALGLAHTRRLLEGLEKRLSFTTDRQLFIEVNPEDVDQASAQGWRELGVDFLSLGVQSFDPARLSFLGRRHDAPMAAQSVAWILEAGIPTVSLDLIFGWEAQTLEDWENELRTAAESGVGHISCYQLTFHEGTPFWHQRERGKILELGNESQAEHFLATRETLAAGGFEGYEVSNYARHVAHRSKHNQKYWHHHPYRGLGPSAHSFDGTKRFWNRRSLNDYESALGTASSVIESEERLSIRELALETLMLSLRTVEGLDVEAYDRRFEARFHESNRDYLHKSESEGWARWNGTWLALTDRGLAMTDSVVAALDLGF